ncbi:kinesin motor domain-containing protein [Colletotrichum melonis]|uniref:Kinesin motor domain-containing protein n=1 Tax=Colletotrichum melonis TaxID=1209925 RepID=A0AAI9XNF5_9PEZI|nr:kinesin motor domain-containing protein [Colletotrichum melonis]
MLRLPASLYAPDATHSPFASWKLDVFSTQMAATKHRRAPSSKPLTHDYHTDDIKYNQVVLSYYETCNDKIFDLAEPPEKRLPSCLPLRKKDGKTMAVSLSERACEGHLENSQDISREKYQESCEDVKTKPSVRGHDRSLTVILEEIPSGRLGQHGYTEQRREGLPQSRFGQDSDVCSYNENDVSDIDKSSCDPCESFSKAKTKHNSNMDLHAVDLVHEDAPERLEARHVAGVVVRVTDRGTLPCPRSLPRDVGHASVLQDVADERVLVRDGRDQSRYEFAGRSLVPDDVLAFDHVLADASRPDLDALPGALSSRSAPTSPPRTTTHFMLSQAFLNIFPLRLYLLIELMMMDQITD